MAQADRIVRAHANISRRLTTSVIALICFLLAGCDWFRDKQSSPAVYFTAVPLAAPGDARKLNSISGRVAGAQSSQRIVLYARTDGVWWVQPLADAPFTKIQPNATWRNSTHPGTDYAALLVGMEFKPPARTDVLPTAGVVARAITKGAPPVWWRWWFLTSAALLALCAVFAAYRWRLREMTAQLNARFEERLEERMRVAQILHDTLLQGVISASMQLHVAADRLPGDSPALEPLKQVLRLMSQVVEEGRNTLRGMQSPLDGLHELARSFSRIPQELDVEDHAALRVTIRGRTLPLQSAVRVRLYGIVRESLIYVLRDTQASNVEMELRCTDNALRVVVRYDGRATAEASKLLSIRQQAEQIGARMKLRRRFGGRREIEFELPGHVAYESHPRPRASQWFKGRQRQIVEPN